MTKRTSRPWWKKVPTKPKVEKPFVDRRGSLQVIASSHALGTRFGSVVVITSKKGTVRANHRHHRDSHLCFVLSGRMEYRERPEGSTGKGKKVIVRAGESVFTPPGVDHAMKFLQDTVFITVADRHRTQADNEHDLVRLHAPLIG